MEKFDSRIEATRIPEEVKKWLEQKTREAGMTQAEFIRATLINMYRLDLFPYNLIPQGKVEQEVA